MDINFSNLCADQLEKLIKRLDSLKKSNLKQYEIALHVINDPGSINALPSTLIQLTDVFNDASKQIQAIYAGAMNKVQRILKEPLT